MNLSFWYMNLSFWYMNLSFWYMTLSLWCMTLSFWYIIHASICWVQDPGNQGHARANMTPTSSVIAVTEAPSSSSCCTSLSCANVAVYALAASPVAKLSTSSAPRSGLKYRTCSPLHLFKASSAMPCFRPWCRRVGQQVLFWQHHVAGSIHDRHW